MSIVSTCYLFVYCECGIIIHKCPSVWSVIHKLFCVLYLSMLGLVPDCETFEVQLRAKQGRTRSFWGLWIKLSVLARALSKLNFKNILFQLMGQVKIVEQRVIMYPPSRVESTAKPLFLMFCLLAELGITSHLQSLRYKF